MSVVRFARVALLAAVTGAVSANPLASQQARPNLRVDGDPNYWETYFDHGVKVLRASPREAELAFAWASQLDPTRAEPLFGRYVAKFMRLEPEITGRYLRGDLETLKDSAVKSADSSRAMAVLRNGFVHRGLEAVMIDRLPGRFSDSRDTRAWIAYSNGELTRAVDLYSRTIRQLGDRARWERYERAMAYAALGDTRRAHEDLRALLDAVRRDDASGPVTFYQSKHFLLHLIGSLELAMGRVDSAKTSFQEALLEDASFAYAHVGLAHVARAERDNAAATDALTLALDLAGSDGTIWNFRAMTKLSLAQYESAFGDAARASTMLPEWPAPVYVMALIRERQGRQVEARGLYAKFVSMAPANDPQARAVKQRLGL